MCLQVRYCGSHASKSQAVWIRPKTTTILDVCQRLLITTSPRVTAGADGSLVKALDVTDASVRRTLGFHREELGEEDWRSLQASGDESWPQSLRCGCYEAGFGGILVPSARNTKGENIVVFTKNLSKSSKLRMIAADEFK